MNYSLLEENENTESLDDGTLEVYIAPVVVSTIIILGLVSNGLLIYSILANAATRTISNLYFICMVIGDLLVISVNVPLRMMLYFLGSWIGGSFFCSCYEFVIAFFQGVSIFMLCAVAGQQFISLVFPLSLSEGRKKHKTIITAVSLWIVALLFALPDAITSKVVEDESFKNCELYGSLLNETRNAYHPYVMSRKVMNFIVYYAVPVVFMVIITAIIALNKNYRILTNLNLEEGKGKNWTEMITERKQIIKTGIIMVLLFVFCWTPRYIFVFIIAYGPTVSYGEVKYFKFISFALSFLFSCIKAPIVYYTSDHFRHCFNHHLFAICCKEKRIHESARNDAI